MHNLFKDDYNMDALTLVRPAGDTFTMYVTPRFAPVYANGYEVLSTRIVRMQLAQKDLFIDVGAHYGYYSLLAATANPDIHLIAIEPIEDNFKVLRKNLDHNGIDRNRATCVNAAVSSRTGRVQFCKSEASDNGSLYAHPASGTLARIEVDAVSLDDLIAPGATRRIFIKTDTDGHELEVLKGLTQTLEACEDVTLLLEMNPKMMKIAGTSAGEIMDHLHGKGFMLYAIDDQENRFYPLDQAANVAMMESRHAASYYNVLGIKKSAALSVLFFSHSSILAGAERSLLDLIRGLSRRGVLCTTVLPAQGPLREALISAGSAVYLPGEGSALGKGWWWAGPSPDYFKAAWSGISEATADIILPEIRKLSPDILFSQTIVSPWGTLCAEALGLPHALSVREYGELDYNLFFPMGFKPSIDALYKSSDAVFCITNDVRNTLFGADVAKKTDVVYSGVDLVGESLALRRDAAGKATGQISPAAFTIGIFGTFVPGKNQGDLIRACLELSRKGVALRCILSGSIVDECYADALKNEIQASGYADRFIWPGFTNDPYALMRETDVIVSCSKNEALGRTLLEACLLDIPFIYACSGGPREIFTHGEHGLAYEPGNPVDLAKALESVMTDRPAAELRARQAHEYVLRRFTDDSYAGKIEAKLRQITRQQRRPDSREKSVSRLMMEFGIGGPSTSWVQPKMLYSKTRDGFIESQAILGAEIQFGIFTAVFDLPDRGYLYLRFDPTEAYATDLTLFSIMITAMDGTVLNIDDIDIETNGKFAGKLSWEFRTLDPQVVLRLKKPAKNIRIHGALKKLTAQQLVMNNAKA